MKYEVTWFRFEHGHEHDGMIAKSRRFEDLEKAISFLRKRMMIISPLYWAGAQITDFNEKIVYDVTSEGRIYDYTK